MAAANLAGNADTERGTGNLLPAHEVIGEAAVGARVQVSFHRGVVDHGHDDRDADILDLVGLTARAAHGQHVLALQEAIVVPDVEAGSSEVLADMRRLSHAGGRPGTRAFLNHVHQGFFDVSGLPDQVAHLPLDHCVMLDEELTLMDVVAARRIGEAVPHVDVLGFRVDLLQDFNLLTLLTRGFIRDRGDLHHPTHHRHRTTHNPGAQTRRTIDDQTQLAGEVALFELVGDPQLGARGGPLGGLDDFLVLIDGRLCLRGGRVHLAGWRGRRHLGKLGGLNQGARLLRHLWDGSRLQGPHRLVGRAQDLDHLGGSGLDIRARDVQENPGAIPVLRLGDER